MSNTKLFDVAERALWTLVQTTTAGALIIGWNALDVGPDLSLAWTPPLAFLLSALKGELATKFGNGSAATLPLEVEPVPPPALPLPDVDDAEA